MIIFELVYKIIYFILWNAMRFIVWVITARDCKHCKYGKLHNRGGYVCHLTSYIPDKEKCIKSVTRIFFKSYKKVEV